MNTPMITVKDLIFAIEDGNLEYDDRNFERAKRLVYWDSFAEHSKLISEAPAGLLLEIVERLNGLIQKKMQSVEAKESWKYQPLSSVEEN